MPDGWPVTGHCPVCGAPIYGPARVLPDAAPVEARYSCSCRLHLVWKIDAETRRLDSRITPGGPGTAR